MIVQPWSAVLPAFEQEILELIPLCVTMLYMAIQSFGPGPDDGLAIIGIGHVGFRSRPFEASLG